MAYGNYQQSGGPAQYQFGAPPTPNFQPQPNWRGSDFYRAHASTADPYLFDHAWNRVREYGGAPAGGMGVSLEEARHWHHRAYHGGPHEISIMQPNEIGHAAAYEAYRTWIHNSSMYEPLSGDIERQREGLTGLAVAEAYRLMKNSSRGADNYGRLAASEAAAHTASYIFYQSRDGEYRSRQRSESFNDPYAFDDDLFSRGRSRSAHGHRSQSRHGSRSRNGSFSDGMSFPGRPYSSSPAQPNFPGYPGSYASSDGRSRGIQIPAAPGSAYSSASMPIGISSSYSSSFPQSYQGSNLSVPQRYPRSRSSSFSYSQQPYHQQAYPQQAYPQQPFLQQPYPQQPYPQQPYVQHAYSQQPYSQQAYPSYPSGSALSTSSLAVPATAPIQTIILHKSKKHHKSHKRSRSSNPDYHSSSYKY